MAAPSVEGEYTPFTATDGKELYGRTWKASGPTKARLVFFPGFSDHIGHTAEFFPTLTKSGIEVCGIDQRGFGHSVKKDSEHGDNGGTVQVMADMTDLIHSKLSSDVPTFVAGHSMGGGQVLYWAAKGPKDVVSQVSGILAIAPWISLDPKVEPFSITVAVGRFFASILPWLRISQKLDANDISRDDASNKLWHDDDMCPHKGTLLMFAGCLDRALALKTGQAVPIPEVKSIWIGHGTGDKITSAPASSAYAENVKHKDLVLKLYPDAYHALHVDPLVKDEFFQDVADFILERSGVSQAQSKL